MYNAYVEYLWVVINFQNSGQNRNYFSTN